MDIVAVKDSELERYVTKIMLEIGVPAHLKGYHYLRVRERHGGSKQRYKAVISHHRETFQDHRSESGTRDQERH